MAWVLPSIIVIAGVLDNVVAALLAGIAYVNIYTSLSTGGEMRGQIRVARDRRN